MGLMFYKWLRGIFKKRKHRNLTLEQIEFLNRVCGNNDNCNCTLNSDGSVDVDGSVYLNNGLYEIPIKFGRVRGHFNCSNNQLTTLKNAPNWVGGSFYCSHNNITSLEFAPSKVGGNFDCSYNNLTSLEFAPSKVMGYFECSHNYITTLKGCPSYIIGDFDCESNLLTSLKNSPDWISGTFWIRNNPLKDYFKNIKEDDFKHWYNFYWWENIQEYPYLIDIAKKYIDKDLMLKLIRDFPQTKLYLK
jgi:hypothetical protein